MVFATAHNGGRTQANFNFLLSGEYPFLNLLKDGGSPNYTSNSAPVDPRDLDANGYPLTTTASVNWVLAIPPQSDRPGNNVLSSGAGVGVMALTSGTPVAHVITSATSNGVNTDLGLSLGSETFVNLIIGQAIAISGITGTGWTGTGINKTWPIVAVDAINNKITVGFDSHLLGAAGLSGTSKASNTLTNIVGTLPRCVMSGAGSASTSGFYIISSTTQFSDARVCHVDDESDLLAGNVFGAKFKARLREANFGVYRFLNWQIGNTSQMVKWAHRKPPTYITYGGKESRNSIFCPVSSNSGDDYTFTGNGLGVPATGGPSDGMIASFKITASKAYPKTTITFDVLNSLVVFSAAHNLSVNDPVGFVQGTLPYPLNTAVNYYVKAVPDTTDIQISATPGGATIQFGVRYTASVNGTAETVTAVQQGTLTANYIVYGAGITGSPTQTNNGTGGVGTYTLSASQGVIASQQFASAAPQVSCAITRQATAEMNGTGVKIPIKEPYGSTIGSGDAPVLNGYASCVYVAALGSWCMFGGGGGLGSTPGIQSGVPYEIMFQLCAEMGAHPDFVLPQMADVTDFSTGLATYLRDNKPSWMIPRHSGVNELWNTAAGFYQTSTAISLSYAYVASTGNGLWGGDFNSVMGRKMSLLGKAVNAVYGGPVDSTKYQVLCGFQSSPFGTVVSHGQDQRLLADLYVAETGNASDAAYKWCTHGQIANYYRPAIGNTATNAAAAAWAGGDTTQIATFVDALTATSGFANLAFLRTMYANFKALMDTFINKDAFAQKTSGYEGGYSVDYNGTYDTFIYASKSYYKLAIYQQITYRDFFAAGGEFPSCFQLGGVNPSNNAWSVLETIYQTGPSPQLDAIRLTNLGKQRFIGAI